MAKKHYYSFNRRLKFWCGSDVSDYGSPDYGDTGADDWSGGSITVPINSNSEIYSNIRTLKNIDLRYWYGGAGQHPTTSLANSLRSSYSNIWTSTYYSKALKDVSDYEDEIEEEGTSDIRVGDCSWFVNYCYGLVGYGTHGPGTSEYPNIFARTSNLKNGYILWKSGHTGLYWEGRQIHLKGIDYDLVDETYNASYWSRFYFATNVTYD